MTAKLSKTLLAKAAARHGLTIDQVLDIIESVTDAQPALPDPKAEETGDKRVYIAVEDLQPGHRYHETNDRIRAWQETVVSVEQHLGESVERDGAIITPIDVTVTYRDGRTMSLPRGTARPYPGDWDMTADRSALPAFEKHAAVSGVVFYRAQTEEATYRVVRDRKEWVLEVWTKYIDPRYDVRIDIQTGAMPAVSFRYTRRTEAYAVAREYEAIGPLEVSGMAPTEKHHEAHMRVFARQSDAWYLERHGMTEKEYQAKQAANRGGRALARGQDQENFDDFLAGLGLKIIEDSGCSADYSNES